MRRGHRIKQSDMPAILLKSERCQQLTLGVLSPALEYFPKVEGHGND
jgi:hypothetical protein